MDIVGRSVIHKCWKEGIIEEYTGELIKVRFPGEGNKVVSFQFPNAFSSGFLKAGSNELDVYVFETVKERKCSVCGSTSEKTEIIDEERFCSKCKEFEIERCPQCHVYHLKKNFLELNHHEYWYQKTPICRYCAEEKTFICKRCEHRYLIEYKAKNQRHDRAFCQTCYERTSRVCHYCGDIFDLDEGKAFYRPQGNVAVCSKCLPEKHLFVVFVTGFR